MYLSDIYSTKLLNSLFNYNFESILSFMFGIIAIVYFYDKKYTKFFIMFFLCLIAFKRIAIFGVGLSYF